MTCAFFIRPVGGGVGKRSSRATKREYSAGTARISDLSTDRTFLCHASRGIGYLARYQNIVGRNNYGLWSTRIYQMRTRNYYGYRPCKRRSSGSPVVMAPVIPTRWVGGVFRYVGTTSGVICAHDKIDVRQARGPFPEFGKVTTDDRLYN